MNAPKKLRIFSVLVIMAAFATSGTTLAGSGGGGAGHGGGGGHFGGGGHRGGGFHRGWRGGGYHGGWYGGRWRGGYDGGWGQLGYGLFFDSLPWYYTSYLWDGVPYYYADDTFYTWNGQVGEYRTVAPPPGLAAQVQPDAPALSELFMYPKAGQTAEQQALDRYECRRWAVEQLGGDPTKPAAGGSSDAARSKRADYLRADAACLEARNYSVR